MTGTLFQSWTAAQLAEACGGQVFGAADRRPTGIANDSRRLRDGELFVALRAERDGHDFVAGARAAGAGLLLVERDRRPEAREGEAVIAVDDTFRALADLGRALWAAHGRARRDRVGLGITGSNGKTTTKELLASLLEAAYPGQVLATAGNLNNHIGLPLTLCRLTADHRFAVLEMGSSQPGDIALLVGIAPVERAVVTSVAAAHLEGLGHEDAVAVEKGAIFRGQHPARVVVVPRSHRAALLGDDVRANVRVFGAETRDAPADLDGPASRVDVAVVDYTPGAPARVTLRIDASLSGSMVMEVTVGLGLVGRHNALNLAAAVALAWDLLPTKGRLARLGQVAAAVGPVKGRLTWRRRPDGGWLLDDTYNANPGSLEAALEALREQPGRRWLVLGDMLELGDASAEAHRQAGRRAAEAGCERVWAVGEWADAAVGGAREGGVDDVAVFDDAASCAPAARAAVAPDDVVLVKGSRGVALEIVAEALVAAPEPTEGSG